MSSTPEPSTTSSHGILFKDRLVRALLREREPKTQTRRIVSAKHQRFIPQGGVVSAIQEDSPYGGPGDELWVREAWRPTPTGIKFRSDEPVTTIPRGGRPPWKPGIHLRQVDARIRLRIKEVRMERVATITPTDAVAEGIEPIDGGWLGAHGVNYGRPITAFASLWDSIHGVPRAVFGADGKISHYVARPFDFQAGDYQTTIRGGKELRIEPNPWTWAITFERILP